MATQTSNLGLTKPAYSETADIADINNNMDKVDAAVNGVQNGMAILANGNVHSAVTSGQYVYVRNHGILAEGLYTATTNISTNATLSTSNLTAVPNNGALNTLRDDVSSLNSNLETKATVLDRGEFSSAAELVNYFKQLMSNSAYRTKPLLKYVSMEPGEPLLFGTANFLVLATFSSANYGSLLCISNNRSGGGLKNICVAQDKAYVEVFTVTETEIPMS